MFLIRKIQEYWGIGSTLGGRGTADRIRLTAALFGVPLRSLGSRCAKGFLAENQFLYD